METSIWTCRMGRGEQEQVVWFPFKKQSLENKQQAQPSQCLSPPPLKTETFNRLFPATMGDSHPDPLSPEGQTHSSLPSCFSTPLRQMNVLLVPSHTQPFPATGEEISMSLLHKGGCGPSRGCPSRACCTAGLFPSYSGAESFLVRVEVNRNYQKATASACPGDRTRG